MQVFDPLEFFEPARFNLQYFEKLSPKAKEFYNENYQILSQGPNFNNNMYHDEQDDDFYSQSGSVYNTPGRS